MDTDDTDAPKTLQDAFDLFLTDLERRVRQGLRSGATLVMHRAHCGYIAQVVGAKRPIAEIDARLIDSWAVQALEGLQGRKKAARPISGHTLTKYACTFRQVLDGAHRAGWIPHVPSFGRVEGRYHPRTEHLRDFAELQRLCDTLPPDWADWVFTAVLSGLGPVDLHRLRAFVDCDPFASPPWMILQHGRTRRAASVVVEMPSPLAERLRARFERLQLQPGQTVLPFWNKDNRSRMLRHRAAKLGISARRASDLRRTTGSWAAHELGSLTVGLRDWMGHRSFKMLDLVYARALPPGLREVSQAISAAAGSKRRRRSPALPKLSDPASPSLPARRPPKRKTAAVAAAAVGRPDTEGPDVIPPPGSGIEASR